MPSSCFTSPSRPLLIAAGLLAAVALDSAHAQQADQSIAVAESETFGAHLTDVRGRPLYLFTADRQGAGSGAAQSTCYDACANVWPPLISATPPTTADDADARLLGTITRKDGSRQVTYNGWPLYHYVKDVGSRVSGQDVHGFGGEWYLIGPDGSKVGSKR